LVHGEIGFGAWRDRGVDTEEASVTSLVKTEIQRNRQADRHTGTESNGRTDRHTGAVVDGQSGPQTDRQTDRQTQGEARPYIDEALNCGDGYDVEERQGKEGAPHCHKA